MFSHYHEVRASLTGARTSMPDSEALRLEVFTGEPVKARDSQEYRQALIADIELYLKRIEWYEAVTLRCRMRPAGTKSLSFHKITKLLKTSHKKYPYYLSHGSIQNRYDDIVIPAAERYFRDKEYIW